MTVPKPTPIRHVSDTALWVAIYRAMESERPDALFKDPYARRLGGERGEAIVAHMPSGRAMAWAMIVRTAVMDEIILRCVQQGAATVLNLAAGLDTRAYRLPLPAALRWYHVDLPDMVAYVQEHMGKAQPVCSLEYVAADMTDAVARREVFTRAAAHGPVLVITEGLLVYLTREQVGGLARELHDAAQARWWLTDLASPMLEKFLKRQWANKLQQGNAPMQFFPPEGTAFFASFGFREAEFRSMWDESWRLKRTMRGAWLWRFLSLLQPKARHEAGRRMSGVVLLEDNHR
jgi:methyltransferase (TIGR00027 family)